MSDYNPPIDPHAPVQSRQELSADERTSTDYDGHYDGRTPTHTTDPRGPLPETKTEFGARHDAGLVGPPPVKRRANKSQAQFEARTRTPAIGSRGVDLNPRRGDETQAQFDARTHSTHPGPRVVTADEPVAKPVTLHLLSHDEATVIDRVQRREHPAVLELDGHKYTRIREQADGSWVYTFKE